MNALLESGRPGSARVLWVRGAKGREVFVAMSDVAAALGFLGSSGRSDEVGEAPRGSPTERPPAIRLSPLRTLVGNADAPPSAPSGPSPFDARFSITPDSPR